MVTAKNHSWKCDSQMFTELLEAQWAMWMGW
jgi:hypothetical protein